MGIHHVDLVVSSIERSLPFYRELLGPLGWHGISEVEGERGETIWYLNGRDTLDRPPRVAERAGGRTTATRVGLHHLAIEAASRAVVDERAEWLRANGALLESEPQEYTYIAGVLRSVLLRPGRAEARDPPCPGPRGLNEQRRHSMSTTPPEPPQAASAPPGGGYTRARPQSRAAARSCRCPATPSSPIWLLVEIVLAIVAGVSDGFDAHGWCVATTWLTAAYILSRGIAKASRVLEQ